MIVSTALTGIGRNGLHMQPTAIHRRVLRSWPLLILRDLDIKRTCLVFIEKIVKLVIGGAIEGSLVMVGARSTVAST